MVHYITNDWGIILMNIPIKELKQELRNNVDGCKQIYSYEHVTISKSIFGLFSKLINKFEKTKSYQTGLLIKSLDDWIDRKDNENEPLDKRIEEICVGDIYMFDWNLSYSPELSYEHPGVVVNKIDRFLFVIPVSSQKQYLDIAYHSEYNPDGDKNYLLVDEMDGFKKKCVIHMNQAKSISSTRILYKMGNIIENESNLLSFINNELINKYFEKEYNVLLEENAEYRKRLLYLSKQRKSNQSRADKYRNENAKLRKRINELELKIDKFSK